MKELLKGLKCYFGKCLLYAKGSSKGRIREQKRCEIYRQQKVKGQP